MIAEGLPASGVDDARRGADVRVREARDVFFEEVDEAPLALEEREELEGGVVGRRGLRVRGLLGGLELPLRRGELLAEGNDLGRVPGGVLRGVEALRLGGRGEALVRDQMDSAREGSVEEDAEETHPGEPEPGHEGERFGGHGGAL